MATPDMVTTIGSDDEIDNGTLGSAFVSCDRRSTRALGTIETDEEEDEWEKEKSESDRNLPLEEGETDLEWDEDDDEERGSVALMKTRRLTSSVAVLLSIKDELNPRLVCEVGRREVELG